jgi:hypothetical protein
MLLDQAQTVADQQGEHQHLDRQTGHQKPKAQRAGERKFHRGLEKSVMAGRRLGYAADDA